MGINIRRRYEHPQSQTEISNKFKQLVDQGDLPYIPQVAHHLISVSVRKEHHRWWSPELTLRLEGESSVTTIFETIGPNPSMFTLAMFFVSMGAAIMIAALMWALSQMTVGEPSSLAWIITGLSGLLILISFLVLAMGRNKAAEQVSGLRSFTVKVLKS